MIGRAAKISAFVLCCLLSTPLLAQTLGKGTDDGISIGRVAAALIFCLILAAAAALLLRARGYSPSFSLGATKSRRLKILETVRLSPQISLSIVEIDDQELLVGASPNGLHILDRTKPIKTKKAPE